MVDAEKKITSKIRCVIKTECENKKCNLVELENNFKVTPWHPIF